MSGEGTHAREGSVARSQQARAFRERARLEADRYGPDPWIFVRELLQNSRDAGATRVHFAVHEGDGIERVTCLDDGEGMSFEHARRYLFSLYASSKENDSSQAGKFGVGFWSILRFEPGTITIRSRTRSGDAWGLRLDGSLEHATRVAPLEQPGTEITLERRGGDGRLEHRVFDAVWQNGRYLHPRGAPDAFLVITVGDRPANAEFTLGAPSAAFRRGSVRGVVGLGPAPRVELFSRGLRVRSAASLEDLVTPTGRHTSRMRVQFPELPGGLAPQALLESDELEVMLSRADARDNRALARLVRLAQRELERLIERQLAHARPRAWWRRALEWMVARLRESLAVRTVLGAAIGAACALFVGWLLWGDRASIGLPSFERSNGSTVAVSGSPPTGPRPYGDLGTRYRGPKVDVLAPESAEPIELAYQPAHEQLHFASLTLATLARDGSPQHDAVLEQLHPYAVAPACLQSCVQVSVAIGGDGKPMRILVPTGHRIVQGSVTLDGDPVEVLASPSGHPTIVIGRRHGMLVYQTTAVADPSPRRAPRSDALLPPDLEDLARSLRPASTTERAEALVTVVRELVRYDRSSEIARRHAEARADGVGFLARTLEIGAGDCDIQNSLLVALLQAAGVEARLAVGYLGTRGRTLPFLHAWAEYRDEDGSWSVADASEGSAVGLPIVTATGPTPAAATPETSAAGATEPSPVADEATLALHDETAPSGEPDISAQAEAIAPAQAFEPAPEISAANPPEPESWLVRLRRLAEAWPWAMRAVPAAMLGFAFWMLVGGRTRRAIKLDSGGDLSRLLQGVLQQPGAFNHMSALFHRPLVPIIGPSSDDTGTSAISLNKARELAALGRLYRTKDRPALAARAAKIGAAVLDDRTPEGRTVANALGAVDLDRWSRLLAAATTDPAIDQLNARLRAHGEDWGVRISRDVPGRLAVLDLGPLGTRLRGVRASRVVLVDERLPWLASVRRLAPTQPGVAAFTALDHLVEHLDLPTDRRARLLADAARATLTESST